MAAVVARGADLRSTPMALAILVNATRVESPLTFDHVVGGRRDACAQRALGHRRIARAKTAGAGGLMAA